MLSATTPNEFFTEFYDIIRQQELRYPGTLAALTRPIAQFYLAKMSNVALFYDKNQFVLGIKVPLKDLEVETIQAADFEIPARLVTTYLKHRCPELLETLSHESWELVSFDSSDHACCVVIFLLHWEKIASCRWPLPQDQGEYNSTSFS